MKEFCTSDFSALIGIDWVMGLQKQYANRQIAVACELKKSPLIYALSKYAFITLFPLHPAPLPKCARPVPNSFARPLWNGVGRPYVIHSGQVLTINNKNRRENPITLSSGRWHLNGSESCPDAGKSKSHMMNRSIWRR